MDVMVWESLPHLVFKMSRTTSYIKALHLQQFWALQVLTEGMINVKLYFQCAINLVKYEFGGQLLCFYAFGALLLSDWHSLQMLYFMPVLHICQSKQYT